MAIKFCPQCATPVQRLFRHGQLRLACPACSFVHFANPRVAVAVFLADRERILLVQRGVPPEQGRWALAAGFVDLGEDPEAAAAREMREETGLDVAIESLLELTFEPANQVIVIVYRARLLGGTLAADDDVDDARWFSRDDLPDLAFASTHRTVRTWLAEA